MSYEAIEIENVTHDNRRTSRRRALRLQASIGIPAGRTLTGRTIDLSGGGMCVALPFELSVGDECTVSLDLSACGTDSQIQIIGRVCYCVHGNDGFRIGLQFIRLDPSAASFIADALK